MLKKLNERKNEGFTIIEVMIVLAIAALILLIVLLAVPAVQRNSRNTQIKNDAASITGGVSTFASDNDGAIPKGANSSASSGTVTLGDGTNTTTVKIQSGTKVTFPADGSITKVTPDPGTLTVIFGSKCGTTSGADSTPVKQARATAVIYATETSSAVTAKCLDS